MAEGTKSRKSLVAMALIVALVLGGYLFIKFLAPAQWHWRIYAYRALDGEEGLLDPPAGYTGAWNNWNDAGRLLSTYTYRNGKRHGPYVTYDSRSNLLSEGQYADGELDGVQKINQEGGARTEVPYAKGKRNGVETTWYPNGQVAVEAPWADDIQEGAVTFYYENGSVQASIPFYAGKIQGVQKSWYEHGTPQGEESYRDNQKNGPSVFWQPDGTQEMSLHYRDDKMDGVQTWFHPNGQKAREVTLTMGIPNGPWKEWDENGAVTADEIYEMGELKKKEGGPNEENGEPSPPSGENNPPAPQGTLENV